MPLRALPGVYARDVEAVAGFCTALGFEERVRMPGPDGRTGFVGMRRDEVELAVTTEDSPRMLAGVEPGPGPRHELFIHVEDVDRAVAAAPAAGGRVPREAVDMPWGERVGFVADPEGNVVSLAAPAAR